MKLTSLGYRTDLMMLAMQGGEIHDRGNHLVLRTPAQPTFHWGNFLLFADPPTRRRSVIWAAGERCPRPSSPTPGT